MSLVVRVITPTGRDMELITAVLQQNHLAAENCLDIYALLALADEAPIGPLLIAEEALTPTLIHRLGEFLRHQPAWSDLPLLILTSSGRETSYTHQLENERLPLGSPVLLERPIRTVTLVSSVRAALQARQRQYEIRDALRERDRALEELNQERETLEVMLDNLPVGILFAKASGEIVLGNRSVEKIFRHPLPPIQGQWIGFHADGRKVESADYPLLKAMRTGNVVSPEDYLYQRGDGTLAWISLAAAPILNAQGVVTGGVAAISDIDQQKHADADLRRSEERFRRLIENASIGVIIGDPEGAITYANPSILKLLGYEEDEVARGTLRWNELTPPEYAEADRKAMEQLRTTGKIEPYQKAYRAKNGELIPLLLGATVIPAQRDDDVSNEIAFFLTNMTHQKQAEAALIQSEKLAAVGRLAASISHEINNPLESVTNLLYLARQTGGSIEEIQRFLDTADAELRRVSQIVSQTLRFHRQSTKARAISVEELLEPALGLYQGRLANSNIKLQVEHRGAGPVTCYEGEIRQVLNNLIGNAIEAMRSGGRLVVRTSRSQCNKEGLRCVRITIADTGHGIEPATLQHIFEPFYTTKGQNGTGLGLWISMGIVQKHHGYLQVYSSTREGKSGTVFSLLLPASGGQGY